MKKPPEILINPCVKWGCIAGEQNRLRFVEGTGQALTVYPQEGDVLTLPFILCPEAGTPVPVRVIQVQKTLGQTGHLLVVVVTRADQSH